MMNEELKNEAVNAMKELSNTDDHEMNHINGDNILCDLLTKLGYKEVVEEFENLYKWYA